MCDALTDERITELVGYVNGHPKTHYAELLQRTKDTTLALIEQNQRLRVEVNQLREAVKICHCDDCAYKRMVERGLME